MTCDDFVAIGNKGPDSATRAERAAFIAHYRNCQSCAVLYRRKVEGERAEGQTISHAEFLAQLNRKRQDMADPEFRQIVEGIG